MRSFEAIEIIHILNVKYNFFFIIKIESNLKKNYQDNSSKFYASFSFYQQ